MLDKIALSNYFNTALAALNAVNDKAGLKAWHHMHLARAGELTALKRQIGQLPLAARKTTGQLINQVAEQLQAAFKARQATIELAALATRIHEQTSDVTLPSRPLRQGGYHPLTHLLRRIIEVFAGMGFSVLESPHVERDDYCFQYLNIPKDHPARDMQDTFFVSKDLVLRTHTTSGQLYAMKEAAPDPVRVIFPGLAYRHEAVSARSEIQFHQVDGLLIGKTVNFTHLKGVLLRFARAVFGADQQIKLRGSFFPFTEPSVEVDIRCTLCEGSGCRVCKQTGWLELLGAGMVHPTVLRHGGYDPEQVRGFAFGMGVERIAMLLYQIDDIRYFFQNDLRFLTQFN